MTILLGVYRDHDAIKHTCAQWGEYVSIPWLKKLYEGYLSRCNELEESTDPKGEVERDLTQDVIKLFMRSHNPNYAREFPHANHFVLTRGHASRSHHKGILDHIPMEDVIFSMYDDH